MPYIYNILIKIDVEWAELQVLYSIIDYFNSSPLSELTLLVEIWEKNVSIIKDQLGNKISLFKKISLNDYLILLKK
jgi:hypothetical protein